MDDSDNRLFRWSKPQWLSTANARTAGVYTSGALVRYIPFVSAFLPVDIFITVLLANLSCTLPQFSIGFFFFIDAAAFSHSSKNGSLVHIKFVDWIPGICSSLGMLVINSIEKSRLTADSLSYFGSGVAWKVRFVLFLGFALLAGGLAGSVVCPICVQLGPLGIRC